MFTFKLFFERHTPLISVTATILFAVLFSALSIFSAREVHESLNTVIDHPVRVRESLYSMRLALAEMDIRMGRLAQYNGPDDVARTRRYVGVARQEAAAALDVIGRYYLGPQEQVARLEDILRRLYAAQNSLLDTVPGLGLAEISRREEAELAPLYREVDDLLDTEMLLFIGGTSALQAAQALSVLRLTVIFSTLTASLMICLALIARRFARRREEERRFREYVLKVISENAGNVFMIYNLRSRVMEYISPNAWNLLGLKPRPGTGPAALLEVLEEDLADQWRVVFGSEVLQTKYERECLVRHAGTGAKKWMLFSLVPVREQQMVTRYIIALADLTEVQKTQQILRDALLTAQRANAAKTEFLSRMSHEIRTPMNAIIGMSTIAATVLDDRARLEDCLTKIGSASRHLLLLINDVLDMSKIENGKLSLTREPFSLPDLVRGLTDVIYPQARAKGLNFEIVAGDMPRERLTGDALRLNQILLNLLSNALKFTPEGGSVRLHLQEILERREGRVRLRMEVSDTGRGMSEEFRSRLFLPFEQETDGYGSAAGTGLGMAITKNIVSLMNGTIRVRSTPGRGSVFTVEVPLGVDGEEPKRPAAFDALRVLVVDDDQDTCEHTSFLLERMGIRAAWVLSGQAAVERVLKAQHAGEGFNVVFMDWKMPDMDGIEATRRIRRQVGPATLIVIISAYDWSEIEQEARRAGVDAFIAKPMFPSTIYNTLVAVSRRTPDGAVPLPAPADAVPDFSGRRFLVVEDNQLNMEIAVTFLEQAGAAVERALNGREAVEKFAVSAKGYYDALIMDVQMPVMDGHQAARAIRKLDRPDAAQVPIVAMTANAFAEDVAAALEAGMNVHVGKPIDCGLLLRTIEAQLARRNAA